MTHPTAQAMQYLLSHGCVTSEQLFEFFVTLRQDDRTSQFTEEKFVRAIDNLNERIKMFNMMVRSAYDSNTRKRYYALISKVDNEITRKASHHTEKEFEYFRLIWERLQEEPCQLAELYNIGKELKLLNYKDLVEEWSNKFWLYKDGDEVKLGVRSELELDVLKSVSNSVFRPSTSRSAAQSTSHVIAEEDEIEVDDDDED